MGVITEGFYDVMAADATLTALLATYNGSPAIFTVDPAPDDAELPYIVTAGEIVSSAFDTKTTRGRELRRDVRCYAEADDSAVTVESMAERVYTLFHRQTIAIEGFGVWVAECSGPIAADEEDAYGRVVTVRLLLVELDE